MAAWIAPSRPRVFSRASTSTTFFIVAAQSGFLRTSPTAGTRLLGKYTAAELGHSSRNLRAKPAIAFRRLGYIGKPDSVYSIAGSRTSLRVKVPNFIRAKAQVPNAAGTVAGRKPSPGIG